MSKLRKKLEARKDNRRYQETRFILEVIDKIQECLNGTDLKKKDVAEKLDVSKGRVSQFFSGQKNLTLRTLASLLWAMDKRPRLEIDDRICKGEKYQFLQIRAFESFPASETEFTFEDALGSSEESLVA
jgi:transcriptional regulator with XRE-family HTH domain